MFQNNVTDAHRRRASLGEDVRLERQRHRGRRRLRDSARQRHKFQEIQESGQRTGRGDGRGQREEGTN